MKWLYGRSLDDFSGLDDTYSPGTVAQGTGYEPSETPEPDRGPLYPYVQPAKPKPYQFPTYGQGGVYVPPVYGPGMTVRPTYRGPQTGVSGKCEDVVKEAKKWFSIYDVDEQIKKNPRNYCDILKSWLSEMRDAIARGEDTEENVRKTKAQREVQWTRGREGGAPVETQSRGYPVLTPIIPVSDMRAAFEAAIKTESENREYVAAELARRAAEKEALETKRQSTVWIEGKPVSGSAAKALPVVMAEVIDLEERPAYVVPLSDNYGAKPLVMAEVVDLPEIVDYDKMYKVERKKIEDRIKDLSAKIKSGYPLLGMQVGKALTALKTEGHDLAGLAAAAKVQAKKDAAGAAGEPMYLGKALTAALAKAYIDKVMSLVYYSLAFSVAPNDPELQRNVNYDDLSADAKKRFRNWRDQTGNLLGELASLREFRAGVGKKNKIAEIIMELFDTGAQGSGLSLAKGQRNQVVDSLVNSLNVIAWPALKASWAGRDIYGHVGDSYENMKTFSVLLNGLLGNVVKSADGVLSNMVYQKLDVPKREPTAFPLEFDIPPEVWKGKFPGYVEPQPSPRPSWDPEHYMETTAQPVSRKKARALK